MVIFIPPCCNAHRLNIIYAVVGQSGKTVPKLKDSQIPNIHDMKGVTFIRDCGYDIS